MARAGRSYAFQLALRECVKEIGVSAQQPGTAGQRFGHAGPELRLECREQPVPDPGAGKAGVGVLRVIP